MLIIAVELFPNEKKIRQKIKHSTRIDITMTDID